MRTSRRRTHGAPRRFPLFLLLLIAAAAGAYVLVPRRSGPVEAMGNRSVFSSQACISYAPTGSDRHRTVFVDPGHGGPDPGGGGIAPDGTTLQEKTLTLAVAEDLLPILRQDGYRVVLSRTADVPVAQPQPGDLTGGLYTPQGEHRDIAARAECADAAGADLLLSIHFNSYVDPTAGGTETLYDPDRPFSAQNYRFANLVQSKVMGALAAHGWSVPDRGVTEDTEGGTPALTSQGAAYGHLLILGPASPGWFDQPSTMPGALCEPLFLTDPGEAAVIEGSQGQQALAQGFAAAVTAYFGQSTG